MRQEIKIDAMFELYDSAPHYCRNDADRVRWLALKSGLTNRISPRDEVQYDQTTASYTIKVKL